MLKDPLILQEERRLALQVELDATRTQAERNRQGQFATPPTLALDILSYARRLLPRGQQVRFLDPAIGTGAFYSALLRTFPPSQIDATEGYEIDPHYGKPAAALWAETGLKVHLADFTQREPPNPAERFNLVICNPPYVRHHHLDNGEKFRLQKRTERACGVRIAGLAGLYCYFLGLTHAWLADDGLAGWLIPSEFMDVNYGQAVKRYLLEQVTLLHVHRFDPNDVQFADALVSSAIVWFRKALPLGDQQMTFTFGGSLMDPGVTSSVPLAVLRQKTKWTRLPFTVVGERSTLPVLGDFFTIKRGLATGDNCYFILTPEQIAERNLPLQVFRPILPSPRYLPTDEVPADAMGNPRIERRLFLLDCRLPENEVKARFPALWAYLEEGQRHGIHERYLCRHRVPWYSQENRPAPPFVCNYFGRSDARSGRPFRFLLNHSQATVPNVYLALYPKPLLAQALKNNSNNNSNLACRVWEVLNRIGTQLLLGESRVYGGGLHKLEPAELARVPAAELAALLPKLIERTAKQEELPV